MRAVSGAERISSLRSARDLMDRRFADPLDLDQMASEAGFSKFHFARAFKDAYGETPANYLTRRRVERAKDLLRSANLTVTEVCMLVGFSSLGSFSSRFSELVGMSPSAFQRASAARGGPPPIPGCFMMEWSRPRPGAGSGPRAQARRSQRRGRRLSLGSPNRTVEERNPAIMIRQMSHTTIYVLDQDSAKAFYTEKLGFEARFDISIDEVMEGAGQGFRWLTVSPKDQPDLQIVLSSCGMGRSPEQAEQLRALVASGGIGAGVMMTDDCQQTYKELSAKGVTFLSEPSERPYGIEAMMRDDSGNMISLTQPFAFAFDPEAAPGE